MVVDAAAGPEDKDALRLEARRQREAARAKKLGPGRLRSIGADIVGVRNQLEERAREEAAAREAERAAREEDEAIRRYLLQVESEDALARRREALALRSDWQLQAAARAEAERREAAERARGVDPETCAPGAAQQFAGEDAARTERVRLQALQRAQWAAEQAEERAARERQAQQQRAAEDARALEVARLQQELHEADEGERARAAAELQRANGLQLAAQREARALGRVREQQQDAEELAFTLQSDLVSENPRQADRRADASADADASASGNDQAEPFTQRVRVDRWKGLSSAQTKQLLAVNDALLADKARREELQRRQADEDARQALELQRALVREDRDAQLRRAREEHELRRERERQAADHAAREQRDAERARGAIDPGFFARFGRSYR